MDSKRSAASAEEARDIATCSGRRQRVAVSLRNRNPFLNDLAKLPVNFSLIQAMATRSNDSRTLADELSLMRPSLINALSLAGRRDERLAPSQDLLFA